jgi:diaminohydroxyphosphoribosylaminopyrimidine deaminase/5-amino-6-(5-phosphoribosylamino)uracil reductase
MTTDELFMRRCFDLARLGAGHVSPNPMVGAILVHDDNIIGEGWHRRFGEAHAEINCLDSVAPENRGLIPESTLYCSLEPCFHFGKTPPCVDAILNHRIPAVVISNTDPNPVVAGQSIEKLRQAGVQVTSGVLEAEGLWLNRVFFHWIRTKQPYVILKWAQSRDGYLGKPGERTAISGPEALRYVHRLRGETDAIIVGNRTAMIDNPRLDTRYYPGPMPLRIALDRDGDLPSSYNLLDDSSETWIFGPEREGSWIHTSFFPIDDRLELPDLLEQLHRDSRASLLVEGGASLLGQFLNQGCWQEIQILENEQSLGSGIRAPQVPEHAELVSTSSIGPDQLTIWRQNMS